MKSLEDVIGSENIRHPIVIPNGLEDRTNEPLGPQYDPAGRCGGAIDFRYLGIKYKASDLWGYGFDTICSTCTRHYTVVFVNKDVSSKPYVLKSVDTYLFILPIDNSIINGNQLCKLIVDELKKPEHSIFIDHYQQYAYKNGCLYVFDNRNRTLGSFFSSVHRIAIKLEAVYKGPPIVINHDYDPDDVEVTVYWTDGTSEILQTSEWRPSSLTVTVMGPNTFIATYKGNPYLKAGYVVNCIWIKEIVAEYLGPPVPVQDYYDTHHVQVTGILYDDTTVVIPWEDIEWEKDLYINDNGLLRRFVSYTDPIGIKYATDYFVPSIPRPIKLTAVYLSTDKIEGSKIEKEELRVYVTYLLNDFDEDHRQTEVRYLQKEEWDFLNTNVVDTDNDGILMIKWETDVSYIHFCFVASIQVKFIDGTSTYLIAWYEGPEIEVGNTYDLEHVIIYLCEPGKDRIQLQYCNKGAIINKNIIMNKDMVIKFEGDNEYEVQYQYSHWLLKAKYYVPGIISAKYPDVPFKVIYIVKDTYEEIDLTNDFFPYFSYQSVFIISWNQFMLRIRDYAQEGKPYFGMFRVEAPKHTGLWNKYASSWHVYVFDTKNLIAEVYKVYCEPIKEDKENGKAEEGISDSDH